MLRGMSGLYRELLDATILQLEDMRSQGIRHVDATPESLTALLEPAARRPATGTPSPSRPAPGKEAAGIPSASQPSGAEREARIRAFNELRERALACRKCPHLADARRHVVFGVGDIFSPLMFVGEAPGMDEDKQGEPFVGKAGQLLTKVLQTMGLGRDKVYIANILKCRPDTPGRSYGNRKPTLEEMDTCKPWVLSQIELIQPKVIVALGATAVQGLLGATQGIMRLRGNWQEFQGVPLMPTFHPSFLLRKQGEGDDRQFKRQVWEDMLAVMEKLGLPISEKQRVFFLPKK